MEFEVLMNSIVLKSPIHTCVKGVKLTISQNELLKFVHNNHFSIIYKRRQEGVSTAISFYMLWLLMSTPGYTIGMLFSNTSERENFRQMINMNLSKLEEVFKKRGIEMVLTPKNHNIHNTTLPNDSRIFYWLKRSKDAIRGHSVNFVYISELTFEDNYQELLQRILPCINKKQKNSRLLITTTDLRNLSEDFFMNGDGIHEYWCNDFFDGRRFVIIEKLKKDVIFKL